MSLRLDFCSREAADFAARAFHYSHCLPAGRLVCVGAWEAGAFVGAEMHDIPCWGTGLYLNPHRRQTVMGLLAQLDAGRIGRRLPDRVAQVRL